MIDRNALADVMKDFPDFSYELKPIDDSNSVELSISRKDYKSSTGVSRKIRKVFDKHEDVGVLRDVLTGKGG